MAWTELLAEAVSYTIPRRKTVHSKDGRGLDEESGIPANLAGLKALAEGTSARSSMTVTPAPDASLRHQREAED